MCRHIHRVHSLHRHNNLEPQCFSEDQDDCLGDSISCVESIIELHKGKLLSKVNYIFTLCFDIDYSIQFSVFKALIEELQEYFILKMKLSKAHKFFDSASFPANNEDTWQKKIWIMFKVVIMLSYYTLYLCY